MYRICADNQVIYYRSELIPCIHGFSTRIGGVSKASHTEALNLALGRGDDKETVIKNLRLFAEGLGIDAEDIISVDQIHSSDIRTVTEKNRGEGFFTDQIAPCDGYITTSPNIALGVKTADCVPILLYAPSADSFSGAVSALHAGWRGTSLGIVRKAVEELMAMGADISTVKAAIGPSIDRCCYTVREDFYNSFLQNAGKELTEKYVLPIGEGKFVADLKGVNYEMLTNCGVLPENIDLCSICTCCHPEEFYSHRYSGGVRGTMLSVISKKIRD